MDIDYLIYAMQMRTDEPALLSLCLIIRKPSDGLALQGLEHPATYLVFGGQICRDL